jgi:hypothetical protein
MLSSNKRLDTRIRGSVFPMASSRKSYLPTQNSLQSGELSDNVSPMERFYLPYGDHLVFMKSYVFWDKTPCSPVKVKWRFGGTYRPHFQAWRSNQARNQHEADIRQSSPTQRYITEDKTLRSHRCENIIQHLVFTLISRRCVYTGPTVHSLGLSS